MGDEDIPIDVDLTPIQKEIIVELFLGSDSSARVLESHISTERTYASRLLRDLEEQGLVRNKGAGIYQLTIDGVLVARALIAELREKGEGPDVRGWFC